MANPIVVIHRSADIERNEKSVDLGAKEQNKVLEINVEHDTIDSRHELVSSMEKRNSAICSETCGKVDIKSCSALFDDGVTSDKVICANHDLRNLTQDDCEITFAGHSDKPVCISGARFAGLAKEVFNQCVKNPAVGFGGCFNLEDTGHVCIKNINIGANFTICI